MIRRILEFHLQRLERVNSAGRLGPMRQSAALLREILHSANMQIVGRSSQSSEILPQPGTGTLPRDLRIRIGGRNG